jgi:hypothetical protein
MKWEVASGPEISMNDMKQQTRGFLQSNPSMGLFLTNPTRLPTFPPSRLGRSA